MILSGIPSWVYLGIEIPSGISPGILSGFPPEISSEDSFREFPQDIYPGFFQKFPSGFFPEFLRVTQWDYGTPFESLSEIIELFFHELFEVFQLGLL